MTSVTLSGCCGRASRIVVDHATQVSRARTKGGRALKVTFYGVRGSTPCDCDGNRRYGGNTSCVVIRSPDEPPLVLDLGTGLRFYGLADDVPSPFDGIALVSHLHWDHVQGIPFFSPINRSGARLEIVGPRQESGSLAAAVRDFVRPPYFPVDLDALGAEFTFTEVWDTKLDRGTYRIRSLPIPHVGPTVGYRIERGASSVAYLSDHQQPGPHATEIAPEVLELCSGVDVLIHDSQYTDEEFAAKADWGHCTIDYALHVAAESGVRDLVLFHHDPAHGDEMIDSLVLEAERRGKALGLRRVVAAHEGLTLTLQ